MTEMKVLFIWTDLTSIDVPKEHLGIAALSAFLKEGGHETGLFCAKDVLERKALLDAVRDFRPDLIAMSAMTNQWPHVRQAAAWLREEMNIPTICGGNHATLAPEEVIHAEGIDMLCRGEGEEPLLHLVNLLAGRRNIAYIPGIWVMTPDGIIRNPVENLIEDLDGLPDADHDIFDFPRILEICGGELTVMVGRGCPFECSYCCSGAFKAMYRGKGRFMRRRTPERVMAEINRVRLRYAGVERIHFIDEVLALDARWLEHFCAVYRREVGLPFSCYARVGTTDRSMLNILAECGCEEVRVGVESGNEWIRREVMNRPMSDEDIIRFFAMADEVGIRTLAYAMVGLPYETREMAEETLRLIERIRPDEVSPGIFYPFPGTRLYDVCKENGWLTEEFRDDPFSDSILRMPTLSRPEINDFFHRMSEVGLGVGVKKRPKGKWDFLSMLEGAVIEGPSPEGVRIAEFATSYLEKYWLWVPSDTTITFTVEVPREFRLVFDIGVEPKSFDRTRGAASFLIAVDGEVVFEHTILPGDFPSSRGWFRFERAVAVKKASSEVGGVYGVSVSLTTRYAGHGPGARYVGGWGRPRIEL